MTQNSQNIHFIAIGGSVMHNMAIALHKMGNNITGSDDEIFEPSRSRLSEHGLLPENEGWDTDKVNESLDAVIVGMHAREGNPELKRAQDLGLKIYSFPEYIYEHSEDKQRVVIAGSHGKTSITSMIMHVLRYFDRKFDYVVGAHIEGFDTMVSLSDAPLIIIEGDEYLTSPLDPTPKFMKYHHHIGLISGISWDHINVFPSEERYMRQFEKFADTTPKGGSLVFCEEDPMASVIGNKERDDVNQLPYQTHPHVIEEGVTWLTNGSEKIEIKVFGRHNLQNLNGARAVLKKIGISDDQFYQAIASFEGADKRLELLIEKNGCSIYKDYAHAPSKVKATTLAVKEQYPERELVACLELHTFSSLTKEFLSQFTGSMKYANEPIVYYNPSTIEHKNLEPITVDDIKNGFGESRLKVFDDSTKLFDHLKSIEWQNKNLLMMSSGTFNELNFDELKNIVQ